MENNEFTYYAFISYSHKDEKWAVWIQRAIEHYKLPSVIRKEAQKPLPKRIAPVFRDATDLGVDVLVDGLHTELENSRYLIVVCSPNSAKPNAEGKSFVDEEVRHFCELGRVKQVIPVIVEGTPEEAFGPVLKSQEILAIDATKQPKARILNDIVAKILGLKPDVLWRRAERERKKHLVIRSILCGILGLAATFIGLFAWDANRTVKNYYANYVDSFGLPEGIFPLKKTDLTRRHIHYRFEYKGFQHGNSPHADSADWCIWNLFGFRRRLVRVVQANSRGYPRKWEHTEYADRPEIQDFTYDRDLRLREIRYGRYNGEGNEPHLEKRIELWNEGDVNNGLIKFFANKGQLGFAYAATSTTALSPDGDKESTKSEISQHLVRRDVKGRVTQRLFLNLSGGNVPDGDGLYGFSYEYDDLGRQTAQWYLFRDGDGFSRRSNKKGVAGCRYEYAGRNMHMTEYVNAAGRPTIGPFGWMVTTDSFDEFDNNTESWYLDGKGDRTAGIGGYAGTKTTFDELGDLIRVVFVDADGMPTWVREEQVAEVRWEYDAYGHEAKLSYFGVDGKPTLGRDGYSEVRWERDERGNGVKESYFDGDGKLTLDKNGCAEVRLEYDGRGNITRQSYFGVDGRPTVHADGCAEVRWEYDGRGNKTKESYLGVDGTPMLNGEGYSEIRWMYDARGNKIRESYFDVDGNLTSEATGTAEIRFEYDACGNVTKASYFGTDGRLALDSDGVAEVSLGYDGRGHKVKESYFGVDGKPILCARGFAVECAEYDERGNLVKETYLGCEGKPVLQKAGYAEMRMEYDMRGNVTKQIFMGIDGRPASNSDGYAEIRFTYNADGSVASSERLDASGNLIDSRQVAVSIEVIPNLAAEKAGVKKDDVWCRLGTYDILKSENFYDVEASIQAVRNTGKELVVARKVGDAYEIHSFKFPVGIMGIRVNEQSISDFDKLAQAYKAYCEKEKGTRQ